jgi:parallel beta-helix repeat protein
MNSVANRLLLSALPFALMLSSARADAPLEQNTADVQAVAKREAARRAAERKPIGKWTRPEAKPVKLTKPLVPPPVTGKTYFVATNGNNETGDGSPGKPWSSIQHGMNQLHPGDRLFIRGGEYRESMLTFPRSGKPDAYITVAGYPGEKVKIINSGGLSIFNLDAGSPWTPKRLNEEAYLVIRGLHLDAVTRNNVIRIHGPMMLPEYSNNLAKARGLRHNIWVVNNNITGGNLSENAVSVGHGAHDIVISNNRFHDTPLGVQSFLFSDGTIIEWNTVSNTSADSDDGGAIKSMAPGVIIRYNTVFANNRSATSKKPGWAPASRGGGQWDFLQGITGIYLDWAMVSKNNNNYPEALVPKDPANYVYGNTVYDNNGGIYVYESDNAQVFDNIVYSNGRTTNGGWVNGETNTKWLEFIGPAGYGIAVTLSKNVKVFNNIAYNNPKAGLTTEAAPGLQAYNNVFFGNDLAQVHFRKGDAGTVGFNTIMVVGEQGVPFLHGRSEPSPPPTLFVRNTVSGRRDSDRHCQNGRRCACAGSAVSYDQCRLSKARWSQARDPCGLGLAWLALACHRRRCRRRLTTPHVVCRRRCLGSCRAPSSSKTTMSAAPVSHSKIATVRTKAVTIAKMPWDIKASAKAGNGAVVALRKMVSGWNTPSTWKQAGTLRHRPLVRDAGKRVPHQPVR